MKNILALTGAAALALTATPALAQTPQDIFGNIFGTLFGDRAGVTTTIEGEWAAGRTPLANQRAQFEARVDSEVRTGALDRATATRLKADYVALVQLENRYGADRRFTTAERGELADRYGTLTQVLAERQYADGATGTTEVADGRAAFDARVNAALAARRLTRTQATRLKTDYAALARLESSYLTDGMITLAERAGLDARLDALDIRVGDVAYAALTPRQRLDVIARALPTVRGSSATRAQLQVEHEDLSRLESAYARINPSSKERNYLARRLAELETRTGVQVGASSY